MMMAVAIAGLTVATAGVAVISVTEAASVVMTDLASTDVTVLPAVAGNTNSILSTDRSMIEPHSIGL
ncbi:MAG TPA: hypothetical protein VGL94_12270 [Ktedonobacteraceae bacterium]